MKFIYLEKKEFSYRIFIKKNFISRMKFVKLLKFLNFNKNKNFFNYFILIIYHILLYVILFSLSIALNLYLKNVECDLISKLIM